MSHDTSRFGFFGVLREMAWAFVGVRNRRNYERATRSNPVHIVLAGILMTVMLVLALIGAVKFAMHSHSAQSPSVSASSQVVVDEQGGE
ncbi:DUF2970 domain-containing protein [Immundisolibacter sp.]|uniref:DUF2970 domain-containing protein n=1 Tax=Immundisolibacter sp. TaxID=1934948 RepID=UPI003567996F